MNDCVRTAISSSAYLIGSRDCSLDTEVEALLEVGETVYESPIRELAEANRSLISSEIRSEIDGVTCMGSYHCVRRNNISVAGGRSCGM
jgi:hypothetical protein